VPEDKQQELNNLILNNLNKSDRKNIMRTIAQKYIDEGKQEDKNEGIEQGIHQGRQEGEQIGLAKGIKKIAVNMKKV